MLVAVGASAVAGCCSVCHLRGGHCGLRLWDSMSRIQVSRKGSYVLGPVDGTCSGTGKPLSSWGPAHGSRLSHPASRRPGSPRLLRAQRTWGSLLSHLWSLPVLPPSHRGFSVRGGLSFLYPLRSFRVPGVPSGQDDSTPTCHPCPQPCYCPGSWVPRARTVGLTLCLLGQVRRHAGRAVAEPADPVRDLLRVRHPATDGERPSTPESPPTHGPVGSGRPCGGGGDCDGRNGDPELH